MNTVKDESLGPGLNMDHISSNNHGSALPLAGTGSFSA